MIIGEPRLKTAVLSVTEGRSIEECYQELVTIFDAIPEEDEVLILVDIYGGTPSNVTAMLLLNQTNDARIQAYAGFNLPVLIEVLTTKPATLGEAKKIIETSYNNALVYLNDKTKGMNDDGNQTL